MIKTDYRTIKSEIICEQMIKKSKFITYLAPIKDEEEAKEYLLAVKKEHYKATHHCSAYICDEIERSNDDGEPASSAGMPMLEVLRGNNLNYVIAVVVRYYGGVQLGVGGLIRAYGSSVTLGIEAATILVPKKIYDYKLKFPYDYINEVETHLDTFAYVEKRDYSDKVDYYVYTDKKEMLDDLSDLTRGEIIIEKLGQRIEYIEEK